jgi:transcriptional regulator with XRE-family HTH domain
VQRKVDPIAIQKYFEQGMTGKEMAKQLKVSPGAISKNLKALGLAKTAAVLKAAEKIQRSKLNAMDRIFKLDFITHEQIDNTTKEIKEAPAGQKKEKRETQLAYIAESRKQVSLWADIYRTIQCEKDVREFKELVLNIIGTKNPEVRDEIIRELDAERVTRGLFGGSGDQV